MGTALANREEEEEEIRSTTSSYPDVIPKPASPGPCDAPIALPSPGNPERRFLLGAAKEILDKRQSERASVAVVKETGQSRIGFYEFSHARDDVTEKLSRLSVQKLPSVTIATPGTRNRNVIVHSVQSPSLDLRLSQSIGPVELIEPGDPIQADEKEQVKEEVKKANAQLDPDDVACIVSEILAGQVELALDAFCALPAIDPATASETRAVQTDAHVSIDSPGATLQSLAA